MSDKDDDLWQVFTKGIKRLNTDRPLKKTKTESFHPHIQKKQQRIEKLMQSAVKPKASKSREIDKNTLKRLQQGKIKIEGRLDLHGMTQIQARDALINFVQSSYRAHKRCVLIITGKGTPKNTDMELGFWSAQTSGVLKQRFPDWINDASISGIVLKYSPSQPKDGGSGAFYVYLRKNRS